MAYRYLTPYRRRVPGSDTRDSSVLDLHRQINQMFDNLFDQDGDSGFYGRAGMSAPAMDIHQTDDAVEITAELPGVKEEDVDLSIDDGVLTLRGEKKSTHSDNETGYRERTFGSFERRITLPANIDEDKCSADFSDGVLTITLPKSEEKVRGRKIPLGKGRSKSAEDELIEQRQGNEVKQREETREKETA